jgi:predicted transcriptional regulator
MKSLLSDSKYLPVVITRSIQMVRRRSNIECEIAILETLEKQQNHPMKVTHLAYRTNLNILRLKKHLVYLKNQELVKEYVSAGARCYVITGNGENALLHYREFINTMPRRPKGEDMTW